MSYTRRSLPVSAGLGAIACATMLLAACSTPAPPRPPLVMPAPVLVVSPPVAVTPAVPAVATPVVPEAKPAPAPLFTPATFAALPGWRGDDLREAWPAFMASCSVLDKKPEWAAPCSAARAVDGASDASVRQFFESSFVPHQVRAADGADSGLVTGYYEPLLRGARKRGGVFQTPLYGVPDDMVTVELAGVYPALKTMRLRGRLVGKKVVPYSTRAEIARSGIAGKELLWVDDAVEAFFLEVQGSGRVALDGGRETVRVAYADQNGHPYKAIGRWLVEQGEMTAAQASAQSIKAWIAANPGRRQELFNVNPSAVFFREERLPDPRVGPKGALGVPLTPARSIAVDPSFLPLGAPVFLSTTQSNSELPMQRLVMAQDTGGAIRGEVRADFFFGFGHDASENAGRMKQRGALWVLLPKPVAP
ncbi:MAG: MltA domain-containing protein [Pseudomonadota bacterium]